jgi:hypothetical protein
MAAVYSPVDIESPVPSAVTAKNENKSSSLSNIVKIIKFTLLLFQVAIYIVNIVEEVNLLEEMGPYFHMFVKGSGITEGGLRDMIITSMIMEYLAGLVGIYVDFLVFFNPYTDNERLGFNFATCALSLSIKIIFAGFKVPLYGFQVKDGHLVTLSIISRSEANAITTTCMVFFFAGLVGILCIYPAIFCAAVIAIIGFFSGFIAIIGRYQHLSISEAMQVVITSLISTTLFNAICNCIALE